MSNVFAYSFAALSLSCVLAATPALAAPAAQSAIVRTADLNLATDAGVQSLRTRISHAVNFVCGDADQRDLAAMSDKAQCRTIAIASAAPQIELAIANARTGKAYAANEVKLGRAAL